jgi:hypothetical protein
MLSPALSSCHTSPTSTLSRPFSTTTPSSPSCVKDGPLSAPGCAVSHSIDTRRRRSGVRSSYSMLDFGNTMRLRSPLRCVETSVRRWLGPAGNINLPAAMPSACATFFSVLTDGCRRLRSIWLR